MAKIYKRDCNWCKNKFYTRKMYRLCLACRNKRAETKERKQNRRINYKILLVLTENIVRGLDFKSKRHPITPTIKGLVLGRDEKICRLCSDFGNIVHHVTPPEESSVKNLITLCVQCHNLVHHILFIDKKWKQTGKLRGGWF